MVRASVRCTEGHGFDSRRGLSFLFFYAWSMLNIQCFLIPSPSVNLQSFAPAKCHFYAPVKVNPDPPPPRDMWGFGGDLVAYWQLSLAPVGGGFARFGMPVPRNVGIISGFVDPRWQPLFMQRSLGNSKSKMAAVVTPRIYGYFCAKICDCL